MVGCDKKEANFQGKSFPHFTIAKERFQNKENEYVDELTVLKDNLTGTLKRSLACS